MFNIKVERTIDKPIDAVFEALVDHANYQNFPGIKESKLLVQGEEDKNGKGALRKINAGPMTLFERIIAFERPHLMRYQIEHAEPLKFNHDYGEVKLTADGDKTHVVWTSKGSVKAFILGPLIFDPMMNARGGSGFGAILKAIDRA